MTSPIVWHWTRLKRQKNRWLYRLGLYRNPFADQVQPLDADVDMTDRTLLFIGGLHRSGTSVLHRILRAHPAATGIHNPRVPESEGQYVQDVFAPDRAFGGPGYFALDPRSHLTEASPLATDENARRILRQWGRWMDLEGRRLLMEKSPSNMVRSRFLQALFPGSRFLFVSRHPLAVSLATQKWAKAPLSHLLTHWARAYAVLGDDLSWLEHAKTVRYEDLVTAGPQGLDAIWDYVGLPAAEASEALVDHNRKYFDRVDRAELARVRRRLPADVMETIEAWGYTLDPDAPR